MPRFYGRVKTFFIEQRYGFIVELGESGTQDESNLVLDREIYFQAKDLNVANPAIVLRKATSGEIVEYERADTDRGPQAFNLTGLCRTPLQCEEGLVVFKRYQDIQREALRREGNRMVDRHAQRAPRRQPPKRSRGRRSGHGGGSRSQRSASSAGGYHAEDAAASIGYHAEDGGGGGGGGAADPHTPTSDGDLDDPAGW